MPKSGKAIEHLWVIVTETDATTNKAICVNLTTQRSYSDTTCILKPGDHPFVKHDSVINFLDAREMPIDLVEQALQRKTSQFVCERHEPCSTALLARIQKGLIDSKQTPKGIKAACKKLWGLE
jgi:hypothetical protein